jgi:hypothetical protein
VLGAGDRAVGRVHDGVRAISEDAAGGERHGLHLLALHGLDREAVERVDVHAAI